MIRDLFNDIKVQLYERATSPLLGSFIISWCIWNYDFILVLLSGKELVFKLSFLKVYIFPSDWSWLYQRVVGPLVTTVAYIYVYPIPAQMVYKYTRDQHKKMKEIQQKAEDLTPLTLEESRKVRANFRALERKHDEELSEALADNERLKSDLKAVEADRDEISQKLQSASIDENTKTDPEKGSSENYTVELENNVAGSKKITNPIEIELNNRENLSPRKRKEFLKLSVGIILYILERDDATINTLSSYLGKSRRDVSYIVSVMESLGIIDESDMEYKFLTNRGNDYVVEYELAD